MLIVSCKRDSTYACRNNVLPKIRTYFISTQCLLAFMTMWYVDYRKFVEPKIYEQGKAREAVRYVREDMEMTVFYSRFTLLLQCK